jgi:hypothetical protein
MDTDAQARALFKLVLDARHATCDPGRERESRDLYLKVAKLLAEHVKLLDQICG